MRRRLEMFNELVFGILIYHMIAFSTLNVSPESSFSMGYSFIALMIGLILVNIYTTLKVATDKYKRLLDSKFKLEAHMKTRNSILWILANKDKLVGSMSARKYESFKMKEEENQDFVRDSALSFINMINRIQVAAGSNDKKIQPTLLTNDDEHFNAEDQLVKFKDDGNQDAIFVNSVSLGEVGHGIPVSVTPGDIGTGEDPNPKKRAKQEKKKKQHKLPRTKFSRIATKAPKLETIQENDELVVSHTNTIMY